MTAATVTADCVSCRTGQLPRSPVQLAEGADYDLVMERVVCPACETKVYEAWRAERLDSLRQRAYASRRETH